MFNSCIYSNGNANTIMENRYSGDFEAINKADSQNIGEIFNYIDLN